MARGPLRRGAVVPGALVLGFLAAAWTFVVTIGLSSTLSGAGVEELAILPNASGEISSVQTDTLSYADTEAHVEASSVQNNTLSEAATIPPPAPPLSVENRTKVSVDSGHHPRAIYFDGGPVSGSAHESNKNRSIAIDRHTLRAWKHIEDDSHYKHESPSQDECVPMSSWQSQSYPNCNSLHEVDLPSKSVRNNFSYVASGGYNDVFHVTDAVHVKHAFNIELALKVLSPGKKHLAGIPHKTEYKEDNFDIVRRDALVLERLTHSPHALPIYGYCGFSTFVPWADGGTLSGALWNEWSRGVKEWKNFSSTTRLKYATDAAVALADIHDIGVAHADLTIKQYMIRNETLQLGDFNRGIFLQRNTTSPNATACTFQMTANFGTTRAPEEYKHEPQTIAVDVWSLGSILYHLLTGRKVWGQTKKREAQKSVVDGLLPEIDNATVNASDPVNIVLKKALDMCYVYEPNQRASAREVASFLQRSWHGINVTQG